MSNKLQGKDLINIGIFAAHLLRGSFCRVHAGSYPHLYPLAGCAGATDWGHSYDAVLLQD